MFNALSSDELLVGIGRSLRVAADADGPLVDYERSQLLSALSVTRFLAAEQRAAPVLLAGLKGELDAALADDPREAVVDIRRAVSAADSGVALGEIVARLLEHLPSDDAIRTTVHRALRHMVDDEVAALAAEPA